MSVLLFYWLIDTLLYIIQKVNYINNITDFILTIQCNNKNILSQNWHNKSNYSSWFMMRVDTQTIFWNLQCRKFNCSSCRCLYRIKIFVVALFLIYPNIFLQRQSYVFDFGYYYAHTSALIMIRHRLDSFLRVIKKNACLIFKDEAPLCGPI